MTVIKTKTNMVCAYDPVPEECFVRTYLRSPTERYLLGVQGIDKYDAAVAWAVSMADVLAGTIVVMPVTAAEHMFTFLDLIIQRTATHFFKLTAVQDRT